MSHFLSVLSATFPEGEGFFIRSVRLYRNQACDPGLRADIKGFLRRRPLIGSSTVFTARSH